MINNYLLRLLLILTQILGTVGLILLGMMITSN